MKSLFRITCFLVLLLAFAGICQAQSMSGTPFSLYMGDDSDFDTTATNIWLPRASHFSREGWSGWIGTAAQCLAPFHAGEWTGGGFKHWTTCGGFFDGGVSSQTMKWENPIAGWLIKGSIYDLNTFWGTPQFTWVAFWQCDNPEGPGTPIVVVEINYGCGG